MSVLSLIWIELVLSVSSYLICILFSVFAIFSYSDFIMIWKEIGIAQDYCNMTSCLESFDLN